MAISCWAAWLRADERNGTGKQALGDLQESHKSTYGVALGEKKSLNMIEHLNLTIN